MMITTARFLLPILISAILLANAAWGVDLRAACGVNPKRHVETVESSHATYTVNIGGAIDGAMTCDPFGYWSYVQYWEPTSK